ncbi:MAG TPA: MurR/RpiR family transcriptional regulator, partial [Myxococcota bacterium]|nr:MurR/RpiR family transcriptional regulator [Myxococcota bacterium]
MSIQDLIATASDRLTPTDRRIAAAIIDDPSLLAFGTVSDLAERVGTSPPSIVRFAARLGFEGFRDLQGQVRHRLSRQMSRPSQRIRHQDASIAPQRLAIEDALDGVFEALDQPRLEAMAAPVATAGSVWILSGETSMAGAHALCSGLRMVRPNVVLVEAHSTG